MPNLPGPPWSSWTARRQRADNPWARSAVALFSGSRVAVETIWTGTLAIPLGSIPTGGQLRAQFGVFFELRAGQITRQRNYDCFDPF